MPSIVKKIRSYAELLPPRRRHRVLRSARKTYHLVNAFLTRRSKKSAMLQWMRELAPVSCSRPLIRVGPVGDGGYLVPDDLENIAACFSPGVSLISGFEKECAQRGIPVFLADKSVEKPAEEHELFAFTPKFIGVTSNDEFMTLDEWVNDSVASVNSDLILQMDIEGYEYEVLLSTSPALMNRFRIIVIEFHHLDQFWGNSFHFLARRAFDKLLQTHTCLHVHPNNCSGYSYQRGLKIPAVMEFTFLRKDRVENPQPQTQFPHPLDSKNVAGGDIILPECWYRFE